MPIFSSIGRYSILMGRVFSRPEKFRVYPTLVIREMDKIGLQSVGIVSLLVLFMGAVVAIQTASNIESGWIPRWTIGYTTRQSIILEFSSTVVCLIISGKVGSNIASEIGTMRISDQIDALDIMGINSASYLILPKIIAAVFIIPFLVLLAMFVGVAGGASIAILSGNVSFADFEYGAQYDFRIWDVAYSVIKTFFFAFIMTSVSSYHGYNTQGGALEVGQGSTRAVVYSIVIILVADFLLTQLLLL
ncbi:MAG: ABC transporter permease [Bacteroidetes bacterium]|nr:ABC transporter permease [Bacteroidota bacterium]